MNKGGGGEIENLCQSGSLKRICSQTASEKIPGKFNKWNKREATFNQQQETLRKNRGSLSSPGTWLSGAQLPGLLGFPHGEEQAPGEQVELREEKGAKSESSPFTRLPFQKILLLSKACVASSTSSF